MSSISATGTDIMLYGAVLIAETTTKNCNNKCVWVCFVMSDQFVTIAITTKWQNSNNKQAISMAGWAFVKTYNCLGGCSKTPKRLM